MKRASFIGLCGGALTGIVSGACGSGARPVEKSTQEGIQWDRVPNPLLDRAPRVASRDPALYYHQGVLRCFYTAVDNGGLFVDEIHSSDLVNWSEPRRLTEPGLNFSSPGNVIKVGESWLLCVQSYPILPGERYGSEESRLWLMSSDNLVDWSEPVMINPEGCRGTWTDSPRQIDPYLVSWQDKYWCFYKTSGCLGLLVSDDLRSWEEAVVDRPVISRDWTPDKATAENPCVIREGGKFIMFFARVGRERGIGVAHSTNLVDWEDIHYLDFPDLAWADSGPTAAMVLDLNASHGVWLMAFHGERDDGAHGKAALGLATSTDLENWKLV